MVMKFIVVSGPVIVEKRKLLLIKSKSDGFYKLPGGTVHTEEEEDLEEACIREAREECGAEIKIIKPLTPNILYENPKTREKMILILINYLAKLKNPGEIKAVHPEEDVKWIEISEIKREGGNVSPNVRALVEKEF